MGLISGLVTAPLAPLRGVLWVAEQIQQEAERQWSDPTTIQRELAELEVLREQGAIDPAEADEREEALIQRLIDTPPIPDHDGQTIEPGDESDRST